MRKQASGFRRAGWSAVWMFAALPAAWAQVPDQDAPLSVGGKFAFHVVSVAGPAGVLKTAAYAGVVHAMGVPDEWRRGAAGYGMRLASAAGDTAIRHMLAFGMDTALRQDPRYFGSKRHGFFPRMGHALGAVVVTQTDAGRSSIATSRLASAVGAAFLSNQWYPDRLNTVGQGFMQGGIILGFDAAGYILSEFWPDVKKLVHRGSRQTGAPGSREFAAR